MPEVMNPHLSALTAAVSLAICLAAFRLSHRYLFADTREGALLGILSAFIGACGVIVFAGAIVAATFPDLLPGRPVAVGALTAIGYTLTLAIGAYARKRRSHRSINSF